MQNHPVLCQGGFAFTAHALYLGIMVWVLIMYRRASSTLRVLQKEAIPPHRFQVIRQILTSGREVGYQPPTSPSLAKRVLPMRLVMFTGIYIKM